MHAVADQQRPPRAEVLKTLRPHGVSRTWHGWQTGAAAVEFRMKDEAIGFVLHLPDKHSQDYTSTGLAGQIPTVFR